MNPLPQLVRQIIDIAMQIASVNGPSVAVEFSSIANQLRVTAKQKWNEKPVINECIELYDDGESDFVKRRVQRRLQEVLTKLNAILCSQNPTRPAA
ncbi:MAG: hypothetical protein JWM78_1634 [Verrucomicrobiaceae bacterium]|nr:hypothetical protein [Verrucomicrobiaceae bacterium]